jgi:D-alanyl-D-alanine carboxypeptidase
MVMITARVLPAIMRAREWAGTLRVPKRSLCIFEEGQVWKLMMMFPSICPSRPQLCRASSESNLRALAGLELKDASPVEESSSWLRRAVSDSQAPGFVSKLSSARPKRPLPAAAAAKKGRSTAKPYIECAWQDDGRAGFVKASDTNLKEKSNLVIGNFKVLSHDHVPPPPSHLTCGSWVILDGATKRCIAEYNSRQVRGMASLTKMMTCAVVLRLADSHPELLSLSVVVTRRAVEIGKLGTTASLRLGETLTVSDLLYAMMLPSGNDAASLLAQVLGPHIEIQSCSPKKRRSPMKDVTNVDIASGQPSASPSCKALNRSTALRNSRLDLSSALDLSVPLDPSAVSSAHCGDCEQSEKDFVDLMNRIASNQGWKDTTFCNPHGLGHPLHASSARSLALLSHEVMKLPFLRSIVSAKEYKCTTIAQDGRVIFRSWNNTNRLLGSYGYDGIKTGITPTAGGCLASRFWRGDRQFIIVTLGSSCENTRFTDTMSLMRWVWKSVLLEL